MRKNIHFDWLAPWYEKIFTSPSREKIEHLLQLPTSGWLLDVGGGTGRVTSSLVASARGVVILDLSMGMLRQAKLKPALFPVQARAENLPFQSHTFTRILMVDAFHHLEDQKRALEEMLRVLAPEGVLMLEEPNYQHPLVKFIAFIEHLIGMNSHFVDGEEIESALRWMGYVPECRKEGAVIRIFVRKDAN
ncbi:MAG: class I SAM-dependent methyltransferase [Thermanaerothrix sp.]|nr:class I SAM-dependent methyltransferase [Thermanaerothrix sp.]